MAEPTTTDVSDQDGALTQARALLTMLREKAAAQAPALVGDLAQLDALLNDGAEAAVQATREEDAAFTSTMAHELRIPMTSIRGYIDMLAKGHTGPLTDMQRQFAEVIRSNVIRMEHLVRDVNDLSKIRAGRLKFDIGMDMYKNLAMGVAKEAKALAEEKGHLLTFETSGGLPLLNVDAGRTKQALVNLVQNALLYTPPGEGQITMTGAKQDSNVVVTITDNGIGMNEEEMERLGEAFWRGDDDLVREHRGHGLGFVLARRMIEMMGGQVTAESEPGAGTTVNVTLPGMS